MIKFLNTLPFFLKFFPLKSKTLRAAEINNSSLKTIFFKKLSIITVIIYEKLGEGFETERKCNSKARNRHSRPSFDFLKTMKYPQQFSIDLFHHRRIHYKDRMLYF